MKSALHAAALGLAFLATPAFAHMGMKHDGCPTGQVFTAGDITISGAFSRATLPSAKIGGGYLVIENKGSSPDRLLGGSTENAKAVQVHQMKMEGDMMKMGEIAGGLEIPAGSTVTLAPGGDAYHLMFMDIIQPLKSGECMDVTLEFEKAGAIPVQLNIGEIAADAPPEHMHHDMMMAPAQ
ncbi:copper chaperone PCu(A)C [Devosia sp. CN2-171]|uniref:copper chaperone PCu(A)C n=1 Tax=Devosia sp. CN2-171 TaxID=3400909 RepID=UPI003BF8D487